MIEKMKFLSITGPKTDIDRVVNTYLSKYEIHLENALSELTAVESLSPFMEINPYKEALATANSFYEELKSPEQISVKPMDVEKALDTLRRLQADSQELDRTHADLESRLPHWMNSPLLPSVQKHQLQPFLNPEIPFYPLPLRKD